MNNNLATILYNEPKILEISRLLVQLNRGVQYDSKDTTRCGLVAESFLNNLYFSSEDILKDNIIIHNFDINLLQRMMKKKKNIICRISWCVWEKTQFKLSQTSGEFMMPAFEHTYLIDLSSQSNAAYIIQAAFEIYSCSIQPMTFKFLWDHLSFLNKFDRTTIIDGKCLSEWIQDSVFLGKTFMDLSLNDKDFIGQVISFTCFAYNYEDAMINLKNNIDMV
jgi:hypothetical protein